MNRPARAPFVLLLLLLLLATALPTRGAEAQRSSRREPATDLLPNGDFEDGVRGWFSAAGQALPTRPGPGPARVEARGGSDRTPCLRLDARDREHGAHVTSSPFDLRGARRLRVSFRARLLDQRTTRIDAMLEWVVGRAVRGGPPLGETLVRPGDWASYRYDVTVPGKVDGAQLSFHLPPGRAALLDDVSVVELVDLLEVERFAPTSALLATGEAGALRCEVTNGGDTTIPSVTGSLGLEGREQRVELGDLAPGETREVRLDLPAGALSPGSHEARARFKGRLGGPVAASCVALVYDPADEGAVTLESGDARLVFRRVGARHGAVVLERRDGEDWRGVGVLPGLGRVRLSTDTVDAVLLGEVREEGDAVVGRAEHKGLSFDFHWSSAGDGWFDVRVEAKARRSVDLAALYFPEVHAGWGAGGARKDTAVFGGLELLEGEQLSSGLEAANEEVTPRYVPHPLEVAIPMMCVADQGTAVGVAWDPLQRWDGRRIEPSSLFASPNRWLHQDDHLMALFVPSIPEYVDVGRDRADRPCSLFRGQKLALEAELFVLPAPGGVADALVAWYRRHGAPEPPARFTRWEESARYAAAAMFTRFDEKAGGWPNQVDDEPAFFSAVALPLYVYAIGEGGELGSRGIEQMAVALRRLEERGEVPRLGIELALHLGHVQECLAHLDTSLALLRLQGADGRFGYRPGEHPQHKPSLGEPGQAPLGVCADAIELLIENATVTGNPQAFRGVLRGLEFTESLVVPAGAQTWEVPILAPDLLAAQQGVDLQLGAWRLTGDARHIEEAKRWARLGLAFVSTWEDPDRPGQLYSSTAVFGASLFRVRWWGMPVQWCGVAYAGALLRLAPLDPDFPWETIAKGLLATCIQQEKMVRDPLFGQPWPGCYTDYYRLHDGVLMGAWVAPWTLLRSLNTLAGRTESDHARVGEGLGRGWTSAARIEELSQEEVDGRATVTARLAYPAGLTCHSVFGGTACPSRVSVAERELKPARNLDGVAEGWCYDEDRGLVLVKHRFSRRSIVVRIEGVSPRAAGRR